MHRRSVALALVLGCWLAGDAVADELLVDLGQREAVGGNAWNTISPPNTTLVGVVTAGNGARTAIDVATRGWQGETASSGWVGGDEGVGSKVAAADVFFTDDPAHPGVVELRHLEDGRSYRVAVVSANGPAVADVRVNGAITTTTAGGRPGVSSDRWTAQEKETDYLLWTGVRPVGGTITVEIRKVEGGSAVIQAVALSRADRGWSTGILVDLGYHAPRLFSRSFFTPAWNSIGPSATIEDAVDATTGRRTSVAVATSGWDGETSNASAWAGGDQGFVASWAALDTVYTDSPTVPGVIELRRLSAKPHTVAVVAANRVNVAQIRVNGTSTTRASGPASVDSDRWDGSAQGSSQYLVWTDVVPVDGVIRIEALKVSEGSGSTCVQAVVVTSDARLLRLYSAAASAPTPPPPPPPPTTKPAPPPAPPPTPYPLKLQTGTGLAETDARFAFAVLPGGDLMAIKKSGTGSKSTEVHILTAASGYQKFGVQTGTALHETDGRFAFAALPDGDLMAIKKSGTGSKSTEVHILTAASGYQKFRSQTGTGLHETDERFAFAALPNGDLMAIMKSGTSSKSTEVRILTAASGYQKFGLQTGTALQETDDTFEFGALGQDRLFAIKTRKTGSHTTEVQILGP